MDNATYIYRYLKGKGLNNAQIAGVMGNFQAESGFMPNRVQGDGIRTAPEITVDGNTGYGIAQWTSANRQQGLVDFARSRDTSTSDLQTQLDFFWKELNGDYKGRVGNFWSTGNPIDALMAFMTGYEGPGIPHTEARQANAQAIYATLQAGHEPVGGGTASGTKTNSDLPPPPLGDTLADPVANRNAAIAWITEFDVISNGVKKGSPGYQAEYDKRVKVAQSYSTPDLVKAYANHVRAYKLAVGNAKPDPGQAIGLSPLGVGSQDFGSILGAINGIWKAISWPFSKEHMERIGLFILGAILIYMASKELVGSNS